MNDNQAIELCLKGNSQAFQTIYEKYKTTAYYFAYSILRNREESLDLIQEAFLKLYKNLKKLDLQKPLYPYFCRIIKNLCIDHLRKKQTCVEPQDYLIKNESPNYDDLLDILERLDELDQQMIILKYYEGYDYQEIAKMMNISRGTVSSRLFRIREKLKAKL